MNLQVTPPTDGLVAVVWHDLFGFFILGFAWLAIVAGFIGGVLTAEWVFDHRNLLRSRLRSLASKFRLSMAIFFAVASCLAAIRAWASRKRDSFCDSVSERSSSKSRKNFSCRAKSRHCKTPPNMNASDAPRNISHTRIQSNDVVSSAIISSNSSPNVKVMAHPLAGANVDRGVRVEIRWKHRKQRG
jgi:hypothetical protein